MGTNRKRVSRKSNRVPQIFSDQYIGHLKVKDFLGELTEEEILVAKQLDIYCWDPVVKGWRNEQKQSAAE